jgi:very-short-patch-repair endonuclease
MAAILACGSGAALSHGSAAELWAIAPASDRIHVSVPTGRNPTNRDGFAVHRRRMPAIVHSNGIPVTDVLPTLLDLAVDWDPVPLERAVNEADRLGLVGHDQALAELDQFRGRRGVRKLAKVLARHTRTDSGLERRFLRLVRRAGLARPETQQRILGERVDFVWPALQLIVETDGLTYHRTPAQQAKDRLRDQKLTAAGFTCLRFPNAQIRDRPEDVIATLCTVAARLSG